MNSIALRLEQSDLHIIQFPDFAALPISTES